MITDDNPDPRFLGIHEGVVVDNEDPEALGRCLVRVPGLTPDDGGAWAWPVTIGGGAPQRGVFDVPDVGSEAYVFFLGGDPERPRYLGGHWARTQGSAASETPTAVRDAVTEDGVAAAPLVKSWETRRFELVFDERDEIGRASCRERVYVLV